MSYPIETIEGIGAVHGRRLRAAGVGSTAALLEGAARPAGRRALAGATGIDEALILRWANCADLMRIAGIGAQYSELIEVAGVDTVKELRSRRAENLILAMRDANDKRRRVRQLPGLKRVARWIRDAGFLEPVIEH